MLARVYLDLNSPDVDTGGREFDLIRGGANCRGDEVWKDENPESEEMPTLDGVVDDFDRMCFDATDRFPVGSVLSLKKGEVATTGAAAIGKTGDDGRRGEAEAGDDVEEEEEGEAEPYSKPSSSSSSSSEGCRCCCWW